MKSRTTPYAPSQHSASVRPEVSALLRTSLEQERCYLRGVAYRITGSVADAEDVVQESFARALSHPPKQQEEPIRPWLLRVTCHLAIDILRKRKRRVYVGPWLPSPISEGEIEPESQSARYAARESLTFAFLLAMEALTPKQRAVLVLRDVLDLDVRETANALHLRESNVKVLHLRARQRLAGYDAQRVDTSRSARERVQQTLHQFLIAVASGNVEQVAALLADDVVLLNDGGGKYLAARKPVQGARLVSKFFINITRGTDPAQVSIETPELCGLPALYVRNAVTMPNTAPASVLGISLNPAGQIVAIYQVLIDSKLIGVKR